MIDEEFKGCDGVRTRERDCETPQGMRDCGVNGGFLTHINLNMIRAVSKIWQESSIISSMRRIIQPNEYSGVDLD